MAKYFFIAGEASGDGHAAALIKQLRREDSSAVFCGLGGDKMQAAGCNLFQNYREMAFMGVSAVIRNLGRVRRNFQIAKQTLLDEHPDVLILIDYPSFNLKMAEFCQRHLPNTKIVYYIPPKVWAWKRWRIHKIAKLCDLVLGIFPFETDFYARYGYKCIYVGNPTAEAIDALRIKNSNHVGKTASSIAILPGSRPSEISHCLPKMLEAARRFNRYAITVCAAPGIEDAFYAPFLQEGEKLTRDTYTTVQSADAAIVNSGTATLETALLNCPQVAVYHVGASWLMACIRWAQPYVFAVKHFTLVNILAGREVILELVANDFTVEKIVAELQRLLEDESYKKDILANYEYIRQLLGHQPAAANAAKHIHALL